MTVRARATMSCVRFHFQINLRQHRQTPLSASRYLLCSSARHALSYNSNARCLIIFLYYFLQHPDTLTCLMLMMMVPSPTPATTMATVPHRLILCLIKAPCRLAPLQAMNISLSFGPNNNFWLWFESDDSRLRIKNYKFLKCWMKGQPKERSEMLQTFDFDVSSKIKH